MSVSGGVVAICYGMWSIDQTLPNKNELSAVVREQTLTIKAANGMILQQQGEATREQLKLEEIPEKLKKLLSPQKIEDFISIMVLMLKELSEQF